MKHAGKLHADDTCTDNGKTLGEMIDVEETCGVNDTRIVTACNREPLGFGACSNNHVFSSDRIAAHTHRMSIHKGCFTTNESDVGMR